MSKDVIRFTISLPTDHGFLSRECNNPDCRRYFRIHGDSLKSEMYCPYCGIHFQNDELWTEAQNKYARAVEEKAKEIIHQEINNMLGKLARQTSGNKFVKITHKSNNYSARTVQS